ncbi:MAG: DUF3052 domain-containing protein [Acidimicrobiia bacterium]
MTSLPRKLGIKDGHRVALVGAPERFEERLGPPPVALVTRTPDRGPYHVIVIFSVRLDELESDFHRLYWRVAADGGLWVAWPKKSSGVTTDLGFEAVQQAGLQTGMVDNKICAIDEVWSGLRFVVRVEDRPAWPPV